MAGAYEFRARDTASPYTSEFEVADGGSHGTSSEVASATVVAQEARSLSEG